MLNEDDEYYIVELLYKLTFDRTSSLNGSSTDELDVIVIIKQTNHVVVSIIGGLIILQLAP